MLSIFYGDLKEAVYNTAAYFKMEELVSIAGEFVNNPSGTPVELVCDKKCFVLEGALWIVTRESLPSLPYSVEEIYGIKTSGK